MKALCLACLLWSNACAADSAAASRVPPNLLLGLSLTVADVASAYPDRYDGAKDYGGYFNSRMCYSYSTNEQAGHFTVRRGADARHECGGDAFSGNMLNWATMSQLDLLRLALTGGDRISEDAASTVLQRAWIPTGTAIFPVKTLNAPAALTPYSGNVLYIASCRDRIIFSSTLGGSACDPPRRSTARRNDLYAGVAVCNASDAASRPGLCHRYSRAFKPEGVLQRYSASMRIGLMSYLLARGADELNQYGGVLRAPLKFIGPVKYEAPDFGPSANAQAEWNAETGVLNSNPDEATGSHSGAINFINQVGRNGLYKAYDPTAELFYEALRYLQARDRSANASDAGFPVWNSRADPVSAPCQRNMIATIGHASTVEDRYLPGNSRTTHRDAARATDTFAPGQPFDIMRSTERVGELESRPGLAAQDDGPLGVGSYYLAGAAYWAHTNAIRRDKPVKVETFALALDGAPAAQGVLALAAKYGGFMDRNGDGIPANPEWSADGTTPSHYFSGAELGRSVEALFAAAATPVGTVQGRVVAARAAGRSFMIQASYEQGPWTGSVQRFDVGSSRPVWDGANLPPAAQRHIYTRLQSGATLPFSGPLPGLDARLVAYVRGERTSEQPVGPLRRRLGLLGGVIHSLPLVVGAPSAAVQSPDYLSFFMRFKNRRAAVYVGANDGMLHAFDAANGTELFAYIPSALLPALGRLSDPAYSHRAFVDGSAVAGEAQVGSQWRTVLASGMGAGARGVFALDVSDPAAFDSGLGALWEFTEHDDAAMGNIDAAPQLARFRVANGYRDFVLVPSGAILFMLAVDKGAGAPWQLGSNYFKLPSPESGLGPPGLVLAADGSARLAYAGDLQGNLWRLDFSGGPPWRNAIGREPLFVARDAAGRRQPITQTPKVAMAPGGGYLVLFGTGKLADDSDLLPASFASQSMYAIHDNMARQMAPVRSRTELAARSLNGTSSYTVRGAEFDFGPKRGWFADFPNALEDGERSVLNATLDGGALIVQTTVPGRDACVVPASRNYVFDALSGFAYDASGIAASGAGTGHLASGAPVLLPISTSIGPATASGNSTAVRTYRFVRPSADGGTVPAPVTVALPAGRLGWREVPNWQELHDAVH